MNWTLLIIGAVAAYFLGHVLHYYGLLWAALVWLTLSVVVVLLFGATVTAGDR